MINLRISFLLLPLLFLMRCGEGSETATVETETAAEVPSQEFYNPAQEGFNVEESDRKAIAVADSIVKYHGGRKKYDNTHFIRWNFFGMRTLYWDKFARRVRIEVPQDNEVYLLNYGGDTLAARIRIKGKEVMDPEERAELAKKAYSMFINDSYWIVQPFKLKDRGVTLKFVGEEVMDPLVNRPSYVIDQTFEGVGDTPQNRYRLYVDMVTYHVNTWEFYRNTDDAEPAIQTPWDQYRPHGGILFSEDRGGRFQLKGIEAKNELDEGYFTEF